MVAGEPHGPLAWGARVLARARGTHEIEIEGAVAAILSWLRTIALDDDLFALETSRGREVVGFPFPSMPGAPAERREPRASEAERIRFIVRVGIGPQGRLEPDWRRVVRLRDVEVLERDTPHGEHRPLRLGLGEVEGRAVLAHVRACAAAFVAAKGGHVPVPSLEGGLARLRQRAGVGVAVWTRGRLRGSVVSPPGSVLRTAGDVAVWACQDARFARLTPPDLDETVFQATILHAPHVELSRKEIETADAYHDKAMFLFEGRRSGMYLPEVFNVADARTGTRRLSSLTATLARDKAGLVEFAAATRVEVAEVTDLVESVDRLGVLELDGPTPRSRADGLADRARESGVAAAEWLAGIQREDGSLPLRVRPSSGVAEGVDPTRVAMTAHALAEFGVARDVSVAVETARRAFAWVVRSRASGGASHESTLTACYLGKAALTLAGLAGANPFVGEVMARLAGGSRELPPLVGAHVLSFLGLVSDDRPAARAACSAVRARLDAGFTRAAAERASPVSLAEWAELGMAPPIATELSARVRRWLVAQQLPSGAFPDTTASSFVYSRGTGKVFEVLAAAPRDADGAPLAALGWLLGMQYRADSAFFIPTEHRASVMGGLRHDHFDTDASIDGAGHLLLGLARLVRP